MTTLFLRLLFSVILLFQVKTYPVNDNGYPTTAGIDLCVEQEQDRFLKEYCLFIKDTIYDVYMYTCDFRKLDDYNESDIARYYIPRGSGHEILLTNEEKFVGYELKTTSKSIRSTLTETDKFVKSVVFHELTHAYFYQTMVKMNMENKYVDPAYNNVRLYPSNEKRFGVTFVEEGICQYVPRKAGETIPYVDVFIPKNSKQFLTQKNEVLYKYSEYFIRDFLDLIIKKYGNLEYGIQIILSNSPPTFEEIMNPNLYFNRLK